MPTFAPPSPAVTSRLSPVRVSAYTAVSALGAGKTAHLDAVVHGRSGLTPLGAHDFGIAPMAQMLDTWVGRVPGLEVPLPKPWAHWDCRNNRLAWLGLQNDGFMCAVRHAAEQHGAHRVALVLGSSTASIGATEDGYKMLAQCGEFPPQPANPALHTLHSLTGFVQEALGLRGPAQTISTACSSSAKAFASAYRAMHSGLCDAAVVGGVDSLCLTTLYGFNSLQVLSTDICRPADAQRNGISIGEAAGFAIVEFSDRPGPALLGYGESSDAHHMSSPHPEGHGALAAMTAALQRAGLAPHDIGYVNLHGTGTLANDLAEDKAVCALLGSATPCSSTKGWTGHTLGAAGILEAAISLLVLEHGLLPRSLNTRQRDPQLGAAILMENREQAVAHVLSNSFGFGGSNCSLLFGVQA